MKIASLCVIAAVLVTGSLAAQTPPPIPDYVIVNAKVFTANPAKPYADAIAIAGEKITAVGTEEEILALAKKQTKTIDARGRRVIPAFNDAHVKLASGPAAFVVDRGLDPTWEQIAPALANAIDETPNDLWITVRIGPKILLDSAITGAMLDEIAGKHLVRMVSFTGRGLILSKSGREVLGLTDTATDPPGGWYGRDAQGTFDGRIFGYAQYELERRYAELVSDDVLVDQLRSFSNDALFLGIASIQAIPGVNAERFRKALDTANLPLRVRRIELVTDPQTTERPAANGLLWILDGTAVERTASVRKPYPQGGTGRENFSDLSPFVRRAADTKQQILLDASGDRAVQSALQAVSKEPKLRRPRIEHGDGLQKDLLPLARKSGVTIVQTPSNIRFRGLYPKEGDYFLLATLLKEKIPLAFGSDGDINPFMNLMWATGRRDNRAEALTPEQAVAAYTRGSAYAEMRESDKGTIAPGMLADIVILSQDVLSTVLPPEQLPVTRSTMTMIGGKIVAGGY